ncbi:MAG TPA: HEAT repeat domain-containing protein [Kofleriaceae bacterium]
MKLALLLLLGGTAYADVAHLDVDGATASLDAQGTLHVGAQTFSVAARAGGGAIALAGPASHPILFVQAATEPGKESVLLLGKSGAKWVELAHLPAGDLGLDADYAVAFDATPAGVFRYQVRPDIRRCDGERAYLFAEGFDPTTRAFRPVVPPAHVREDAPTLTAHADTGGAIAPVVFRAHAASTQPGAENAAMLAIPAELDDGNAKTAWTEDLGSDGRGQFFTFQSRVPGAVAAQLRIMPAEPAGGAAENRVRDFAIVTADKQWRVTLPDVKAGAVFAVDFPAPVTDCVSVVLLSTHGSPTGKTAIPELEILAAGERADGGAALLVHVVATDAPGAQAALAALGKLGPAAAPAITAAYDAENDPKVRVRLVAALAAAGDASSAPTLAKALASGILDDATAELAAKRLATVGALEALRDVAAASSAKAPQRVIAAAQLSPAAPGAIPLLVSLAGIGPREVRAVVGHALAEAPAPVLVHAAQGAGEDHAGDRAAGDLWLAAARSAHRAAATATQSLAETRAALVAALGTATDYERRYRLVQGIAITGDDASIAQLSTLIDTIAAKSPLEGLALRQVAINSIAATPSTDARTAATTLVLAGLRDADPGVRIAALRALASATGDAAGAWHHEPRPDDIDRALQNPLASDAWPEVRTRAAVALGGRCQRPGPAAALRDALGKDPDVRVRGEALEALVTCRAPGVADVLAYLWDSKKAALDTRTRAVTAAIALEDPSLGAPLVAHFTHWRREAMESPEALTLAQAAAAAIARLHAPGAADALTSALDDTAYPEIVAAAAAALGSLGPACPAAARPKLEALSHGDEQYAVAARTAARACGAAPHTPRAP